LLADLALAFCTEQGIQVPRDTGEAYRLYHKAMQRGSEKAYQALRRMYNALRPKNNEFQVDK
jgi:TPR repeat protein